LNKYFISIIQDISRCIKNYSRNTINWSCRFKVHICTRNSKIQKKS